MDDVICPFDLLKLRVSFNLLHVDRVLHTVCAELCIFTAYFEAGYFTPHPSFQTILGPCSFQLQEVLHLQPDNLKIIFSQSKTSFEGLIRFMNHT